jgi:uncharacterized membrane protein YcaP (DUF421 family)
MSIQPCGTCAWGKLARNMGIEQFTEIRLAVLETNGRLSFLARDARFGAA